MKKGIFITVEGPNGVGKSSFIDALSRKLSPLFPVYLTREPSQTQFGDFVKRYEHHLCSMSYAQLIWSDRYFHTENFVLPELNKGNSVICDRYIESSFVLQGFDGISNEKIWEMNKDFIKPDISIVLLATPTLLGERLATRSCLTRYEVKMTREQEVSAYRGAVNFLTNKGFNFLVFKNNTMENLDRNVSEVYGRVCEMMGNQL